MQDVDWNLALARLSFLHGYIRWMRKEINVKNEKLAERAEPARRRFWHRAFHRPPKPKPLPSQRQAVVRHQPTEP